MFDVGFWLAVSFVIFIMMIYRPVRNIVISFLDKRAFDIKKQLEEADNSLTQANLMLEKIKEKYKTIDKEISEVSKNCEREIALMLVDTEKNRNEYLSKKTIMMNEKIANDEKKLLNEMRKDAVLIATKISTEILRGEVSDKEAGDVREKSLDRILAEVGE